QENYEFNSDNFYMLQLSSVSDSFANPVILDTISNASDTLVSFLPDTLQFERPYLVRVISSDLGIHSQPEELIYYDLPSAEFSLADEACQADTITITYLGETSEGLSFDWDLDETILVENQGDTLIKIIGGAYGEKIISLTTTKNGCSATVTKTTNIKKTPSATFDVKSEICEGETAIVTYTGNGADSAQYIWDFGDATVISGEKSGPYELIWSSFGLKRIGLKVTENGCSFGENAVVFHYSEQPKLAFEGVSSVCYNDNYQIEYTGTQEGDITWDFKNATIISGSGAGPYLIKWDSSGEKSIGFSIDNHNCISDTTINITVTPQPVVPEICLVTVDEETSNNMLVWGYDMETVDKFGIYRETNTANDYQLIEYIEGGQFNTYIDSQSSPDQNSNRYKITAVDSCGTETELSDFHKTIHLTINKGLEDSWNLIWDSYEGFTFGTYNIYRSINDGEFELVKELASNLTSYTDKNVVANPVAYQIEVVNPDGCGESANGRILQYTSSKSNVARIGTVTGIEDNLLDNMVSVSPNPASNFLHIDFNKRLSGNYSITNLDGKEIKKGIFNSNFKINLQDYKSGIYFLNITTTEGSIIKKILKD
ncbi:T9SS type A sorting domain-containing protein, partial [Flexithrix dorotheae]|uniref:T9SS type A sorting domain-containing protein n=1 Tax=Flexithrix dorotheae TaxID=70993 RepID=UPI0005C46E84